MKIIGMKIFNNFFMSVSLLFLFIAIKVGTTNAQTAGAIVFNPSSLTMYVGESKTVTISGGSSYSIGTNSNPSAASAVLNGSSITVTGYSAGTGSVSVCSYVNGAASCGAFGVIVSKQQDTQQQNSSRQQATISFSKSDVTVNIGQTEKVTVYGSGTGAYYISGYGSDAVNAYIEGSVVTLTGNKVGGSNVSVCQFGGTCANLYGFVPNTTSNSNAQVVQNVQSVAPALSAFYMASNNIGGGFTGKGATLTFKFNTNVDVTGKVLKVGGQVVGVTGSGSGPFGGTYTMMGNESMPLPIYIEFTTIQGVKGHASFTTGDVANASASIPAVLGQQGLNRFNRILQNGSVGTDVLDLQALLKKLGVYNGPVTGTFGAQTTVAVKKYQAKNNLKQVGVVGPATKELLNKEQ